jgi:outer membrane lipoprotein-sorting protein
MTRNPVALVLGCTVLLAAVQGFGAPQASNSLESALAAMDKASATFKGLTADIRRHTRTEVVDQDDIEEGTVEAKKTKPTDTRIKIHMAKPEEKFYYIGGGKALIYTPKSQEAQEGEIGKESKDLVNQLMLLAFGSNSAQLKAAYTIKLGGADTVNGEKTTRIELTPKSQTVVKYVTRCDIWISEKGLAVQQKFFQPGGDYVLTTYTHMRMVPNLPDPKLELPKGVKPTKIR